MVSTNDQQEVLHEFFEEPIPGPLKFKMVAATIFKIIFCSQLRSSEIGCSKWKKTLAYLLVLPGSRARIVRCGGRYDPQLVKRSNEMNENDILSVVRTNAL